MNLLPQFGFFELVLVAAIALMVVGPKDLPKLMRSAGRMAAQARRMASEFTSAFDQMAREAEMEEMRKEIESLKAASPVEQIKKAAEEVVAPIKKAVGDADVVARGGAVAEPASNDAPDDDERTANQRPPAERSDGEGDPGGDNHDPGDEPANKVAGGTASSAAS
ncbi:MAG: Sec-independent protein translocase protein TatB [Pseudomonadota bacterium]